MSAGRIVYSTITDLGPAFINDTCGVLISDNIALAAVIVFEVATNLLLAGYGIFVFYQFLRERATARPHFNTWAIGSLAVILVDAALVKVVLPEEPLFSPETSREIARAAGFAAVWISYLHVSVRARNTLVR